MGEGMTVNSKELVVEAAMEQTKRAKKSSWELSIAEAAMVVSDRMRHMTRAEGSS